MPKWRRIIAINKWPLRYKLLGGLAAAIALVACGGLLALVHNSATTESKGATPQQTAATPSGNNEITLGNVNGTSVTQSTPPNNTEASTSQSTPPPPTPQPTTPHPSPAPSAPTPPPPPTPSTFSVTVQGSTTIHINAGESGSATFGTSDGRSANWSGDASASTTITATGGATPGSSYTVDFNVSPGAASGDSLVFTATAHDNGSTAYKSVTVIVN